jgi:hypothetical protein
MPRIEVACAASVREDGSVHRVHVVNISQGGLKVTTSAQLAIGSDVIVTLAGLEPIAGVVRWRQNSDYGVTFNRALGLPVLVGWLQEQQKRQPQAAARRAG